MYPDKGFQRRRRNQPAALQGGGVGPPPPARTRGCWSRDLRLWNDRGRNGVRRAADRARLAGAGPGPGPPRLADPASNRPNLGGNRDSALLGSWSGAGRRCFVFPRCASRGLRGYFRLRVVMRLMRQPHRSGRGTVPGGEAAAVESKPKRPFGRRTRGESPPAATLIPPGPRKPAGGEESPSRGPCPGRGGTGPAPPDSRNPSNRRPRWATLAADRRRTHR